MELGTTSINCQHLRSPFRLSTFSGLTSDCRNRPALLKRHVQEELQRERWQGDRRPHLCHPERETDNRQRMLRKSPNFFCSRTASDQPQTARLSQRCLRNDVRCRGGLPSVHNSSWASGSARAGRVALEWVAVPESRETKERRTFI